MSKPRADEKQKSAKPRRGVDLETLVGAWLLACVLKEPKQLREGGDFDGKNEKECV